MVTVGSITSRKLRLAAVVAALGLAMGIGGGVATASQQAPKAKSVKQAAIGTPRTCGTPANYTTGSISISVKGCLEGVDDGTGGTRYDGRASADATVTARAGMIVSCRVESELTPGATAAGPSTIGAGVWSGSCTDAVNMGMHTYLTAASRIPGTYWYRVTVQVVTRTGTVRLAVATHSATLS
jgi:hypothetical protein